MTKKSGKTGTKKASAKTVAKPRRIKLGEYKTLRIQKRIKHPIKLPNVWQLTKMAAIMLWQNKLLFIGITAIYGLLNVVLAQGLSGGTDLTNLKHTLDQLFQGHLTALASGLSIFVIMVSSAGNTTNAAAGTYQLVLLLVASLALIWALRQVTAGTTIRIRDAFYRGMYPLVPFVLVLLVIGLQLIPLLIGSAAYSAVVNNGIAIYAIEKFVWALLYGLLALLSIYMISSSLFALYIVTLPDMTPIKALRSARTIVKYRRGTVMIKVVSLPIILLIIAAIIMLPIIIWLTPLAQVAFFVLSTFGLAAVHAYMYTLYRELLND